MMVPSRRRALARVLIAVAKTQRDEKGNPAPHAIPLAHAETAIIRLEAAWALPEQEIERLIANISVGLVK